MLLASSSGYKKRQAARDPKIAPNKQSLALPNQEIGQLSCVRIPFKLSNVRGNRAHAVLQISGHPKP